MTPGNPARDALELNDVQSQLNATHVDRVSKPASMAELQALLVDAKKKGRAISVSGGKHAMGCQQFGSGNEHIDLTGLKQIRQLDTAKGLMTFEAGIQWPELIDELHRLQPGDEPWTIREKQTGVDAVTLAGSLSANVHGRGLHFPPIVHDVESIELLTAAGEVLTCSRRENAELFSLAIGGYGLFGIITAVTLRLVRQFKVRRDVELITLKDLPDRLAARLKDGALFGDCQYSVDLSGPAEDHPGVFPCYVPVPSETPVTADPEGFSEKDWAALYKLIRTDKRQAFEEYAEHYQRTHGQVYWSDRHQLAGEFVGHRTAVQADIGTEMITEVYVSHDNFLPFMERIRQDLVASNADLTYGTIRYIEADTETFLPWAKERSVCVVCNLHVRHTEAGISKAKRDFRQIIDRAIEFGGSFYLTYHRWASAQQIAACYPTIREFFQLKRKYDPQLLFQSDWYRQYAAELAHG
jgi:FAD/FMN-containing dehydrogenase